MTKEATTLELCVFAALVVASIVWSWGCNAPPEARMTVGKVHQCLGRPFDMICRITVLETNKRVNIHDLVTEGDAIRCRADWCRR